MYVVSLRTAPTWRTTTASTREREKRRGGRGQYCLPHRHCMDVRLIRPLPPSSLSPSLPLPPVHSSVLLTLLFVLHLAPEHRGALARRPRPNRRTHFRRRGEEEGRGIGGKMKKEGAAGEGAAAAAWIHQCWRHTWTGGRLGGREGRRSGLSRLAHRGKGRERSTA